MMNKDLYRAAVNDIKIDEKFKTELAQKMKEKSKMESAKEMKEKPKNLKKLSNYGLLAASVAVFLIMAVFVQNKTGIFSEKRIAVLSPEKSITLSQGKGTIYINKSEGTRSSKIFIPEGAYSKDYTLEQLQEVFGRNPLPVMLEGFQTDSNRTSITFDKEGKMLFMNMLVYSKDLENPEAPSINIKLNKNALPLNDCIYTSKPTESTIGNTKVVIGAASMGEHFDNNGKPTSFYDLYSAAFIYKGVGYNIVTERTDGQTMLDLLNSIIK
jgi:hypothetical protein